MLRIVSEICPDFSLRPSNALGQMCIRGAFAAKIREALYGHLGESLRNDCVRLWAAIAHLPPEILRPVWLQLRWATAWWTSSGPISSAPPLILAPRCDLACLFWPLIKPAPMPLSPWAEYDPLALVNFLLMSTPVHKDRNSIVTMLSPQCGGPFFERRATIPKSSKMCCWQMARSRRQMSLCCASQASTWP